MSTECPPVIDPVLVRKEIASVYLRVAGDPAGEFHFHRGPEYAARVLRYDPMELETLPRFVAERFAGIGNPLAIDGIRPGETVVDVGCGAGMDLLLAARRAGPSGMAIGVDMIPEMREIARRGAREAGLTNVEVREGDATSLPVEDGTADVVISNGVLNLVPEKSRAYSELARVLRPGGRLLLSDIAVESELDQDTRNDIDLWAG